MKATVVEISGYVPAFIAMYTTGKNVDEERLDDILETVRQSCTFNGFRCDITEALPEHVKAKNREHLTKFDGYMDKLMKYGIAHEHETLLDFIKISIFMEDLHRGAQDDWDAHARRLDIIRSSTRANKKSSGKNADLSDWYRGKVLTFDEALRENGTGLDNFKDRNGIEWVRTPWGYVRKDLEKDPDVLRGLVPLGLACDNISTVSFRNLRHIYDLRRPGSHAAPELQEAVEQVRNDLKVKCPVLGEHLGKVWVPNPGIYVEKPDTVFALKPSID
jgi:hypothetical protein